VYQLEGSHIIALMILINLIILY